MIGPIGAKQGALTVAGVIRLSHRFIGPRSMSLNIFLRALVVVLAVCLVAVVIVRLAG